MASLKVLKEPEIQIVHDWLRTMGMSVNRLLNREYADGFLIARLLKKMYPQLVNIHSYQRSYSYDVKTKNWRTLNFKVLRRIGLSLSDEQIQSLAKGEDGSIEQLMWVIMNCSVHGKNFKVGSKEKISKKKIHKKHDVVTLKAEALPEEKSLAEVSSKTEVAIIGDSENIPYEFYEEFMAKGIARIAELQNMIKKRDEEIKMLKSYLNIYESENREFHKVIALIRRVYTL